jgi:hypothetical protein
MASGFSKPGAECGGRFLGPVGAAAGQLQAVLQKQKPRAAANAAKKQARALARFRCGN